MNATLFTNKLIKPVMIISFILLGFYSLSGQDTQIKENQDIDIYKVELIERVNELKLKSEKLMLIVNSNKNFVMNENMAGMHARDKVIELMDEFSSLTNSLWGITSQLNDILSSSEVLENEETRENFSAMSFNLDTIINGSENFLANIELYQKILMEHNMNYKQNR